jgi:DNA-binding transcriptional LysR family regulator
VHRERPASQSLAVFEAAARLASFSKAADELHDAGCRQPYQDLEEWLGRPSSIAATAALH